MAYRVSGCGDTALQLQFQQLANETGTPISCTQESHSFCTGCSQATLPVTPSSALSGATKGMPLLPVGDVSAGEHSALRADLLGITGRARQSGAGVVERRRAKPVLCCARRQLRILSPASPVHHRAHTLGVRATQQPDRARARLPFLAHVRASPQPRTV